MVRRIILLKTSLIIRICSTHFFGGYKEGSFCMTLGYPGSTERYLSSYGIEEMMNGINQAMIDVRGVKQAVWKREMDRRPDIRIKYASKYDESSNYWKNSIGTNKAIKHLKVLEKKRAAEAALRDWIQSHPEEREKLIRLFSSLELSYSNRRETNRALLISVNRLSMVRVGAACS